MYLVGYTEGAPLAIEGLNVSGNPDEGLYGYSSASYGNTLALSDVTADDNGGRGIYLSNFAEASFEGVSASGNGEYGVYLNAVEDVAISGAAIDSNGMDGVWVYAGDFLMRDSSASSNAGSGLYLSQSDVTLLDNVIESNGAYGLWCDGSNDWSICATNSLEGNTSGEHYGCVDCYLEGDTGAGGDTRSDHSALDERPPYPTRVPAETSSESSSSISRSKLVDDPCGSPPSSSNVRSDGSTSRISSSERPRASPSRAPLIDRCRAPDDSTSVSASLGTESGMKSTSWPPSSSTEIEGEVATRAKSSVGSPPSRRPRSRSLRSSSGIGLRKNSAPLARSRASSTASSQSLSLLETRITGGTGSSSRLMAPRKAWAWPSGSRSRDPGRW